MRPRASLCVATRLAQNITKPAKRRQGHSTAAHRGYTMQGTPQTNNGAGFVPLTLSRDLVKRANGLKAFCIIELLLAVLGGLFIHYMFFMLIPTDIVGIISANRMNVTLMAAFSFLKLLALAIFAFLFLDLLANHYYAFGEPVFLTLMIALLIYQMLGIYFSVKLRREILLAQRNTGPTVELNSIDAQHPMSQMAHMQMAQMAQMSQMPQYPQDPHSTSGVPGYTPYPPQPYYPAMYMNQGYPAPYAPYPMAMVNPAMASAASAPPQVPVSPYPTYTISPEEQPQTTPADHALLQNN